MPRTRIQLPMSLTSWEGALSRSLLAGYAVALLDSVEAHQASLAQGRHGSQQCAPGAVPHSRRGSADARGCAPLPLAPDRGSNHMHAQRYGMVVSTAMHVCIL